jgi:methionyl-tRNA formyltransferase
VRKLKLFRAAMREDYTGKKAGTLLPNESKLLVATGTSVLQLEEVQLEGKRRMSAADFLRGFSSPNLHF